MVQVFGMVIDIAFFKRMKNAPEWDAGHAFIRLDIQENSAVKGLANCKFAEQQALCARYL